MLSVTKLTKFILITISLIVGGLFFLWFVSDTLSHNRIHLEGGVGGIAFHPDGTLLAVGGGTTRIWDFHQKGFVDKISPSGFPVAWSADGQYIVGTDPRTDLSGSGIADTAWIWSVQDRAYVTSLQFDSKGIDAVAWSPRRNVLLTASRDGQLRLWHIPHGKLLRLLTTDYLQIESNSARWSLNGQTIVALTTEGDIAMWRGDDGAFLRSVNGIGKHARSIAISPDGRTLALGFPDTTIQLWSLSDEQLLHTLKGHTDAINCLDFSPDGKLVASGAGMTYSGHAAADTTIRVWRVSDGNTMQLLEGHGSAVESVAFSPNGDVLASTSLDSTLRFWQIK